MQRLVAIKVVVKLFEGFEKTSNFLGPWKRCGILPYLFALTHAQSPVKQVSHVREDLYRGARRIRGVKIGKGFRCIAKDFCRAVSGGCEAMPQELAGAGSHFHGDLPVQVNLLEEICQTNMRAENASQGSWRA